MEEAFGSRDYCDPIERPHVYFQHQDRIVMLGCAAAVVALVVISAMGWLA